MPIAIRLAIVESQPSIAPLLQTCLQDWQDITFAGTYTNIKDLESHFFAQHPDIIMVEHTSLNSERFPNNLVLRPRYIAFFNQIQLNPQMLVDALLSGAFCYIYGNAPCDFIREQIIRTVHRQSLIAMPTIPLLNTEIQNRGISLSSLEQRILGILLQSTTIQAAAQRALVSEIEITKTLYRIIDKLHQKK
jgi:DNA-binding NarL/FixJ family response regulator